MVSSTGLRLVCAALAVSCIPVRFVSPTFPVVPAAVVMPTLPPSETRERVTLPDDTRVASSNARLPRNAVLALGPVPGAASISWEFLRRLLARATVPVLDLTGIDAVTAQVESNARSPAVRLNGPLLAATWAAHFGSATHLLVTESLTVSNESVRVARSEAPSPEAAARYQEAMASAVAQCRALIEQSTREQASLEAAWQQAERQFRARQNFLTVADLGSVTTARSAYENTLASLAARREACQTLVASRDGTPRESTHNDQAVRPVARGSFRVLSVPGGVLVWSASLARVAETQDAAVVALLDAALDALPAFAATPVVENATTQPSDARPRRGHHRRRRGDPR